MFVYKAGDTGNDQLRDFSVAEDKLDVSALGITTLAEATAGATAGTNGVELHLGTQTATLYGVTLARGRRPRISSSREYGMGQAAGSRPAA